MNSQWSAETLAAQALGEVDAASGAITPAIHPSTSYERNPDGTYRSGLAYTRSDNPTYDHAERLLTTLESGASCMLFASGSAAATVLTRPIDFGVDLVVHSATKYLNGHGDVLAGAVVTARADAFWECVRVWRRTSGSVLGPFEAWLLQRGMRTLFLRVRRSSETALAVARHFEGHQALSAVLYPGLPSHPGHDIAARQMSGGFSGMLSIRVAGGEREAMTVAGSATLFKRGTSLGGVESLIEHRKSTEGAS